MGREPPRLLGLSDIAREVGMSRQAIADFYERGKIPRADFRGPKDGPLWRAKSVAEWIEEKRRPNETG